MKTKVSQRIRDRIESAGGSFFANENISEFLLEGEAEELEKEVEAAAENLLQSLVIDTARDHNSIGTAKRLAKMYVREIYAGRYVAQPNATEFPNAADLDQLYTVGPIAIRSACSHHHMPIHGNVWIGIHPSSNVLGLSKFHRLTEWITARPSIQEETTVQLADLIEDLIEPHGIGVIIKAKHMCCSHRGVKDDGTWMTTSVVRGTLREDPSMKQEFMALIGS